MRPPGRPKGEHRRAQPEGAPATRTRMPRGGRMLVLRFAGWATIRIPTDPDPTDEPRGASGYTFAFAGEADLDRIIRLQPQDEPALLRSGSPWPWGVFVTQADLVEPDGKAKPIPALKGAAVRLLGTPRLENRNWLLTLPGWEPIVPFDLQIRSDDGLEFRRTAPLVPGDSPPPFWQLPQSVLMGQGATGVYLERETLGAATGIWDSLHLVRERQAVLRRELAGTTDPVLRARLQSRLNELAYALANPTDRRVMARYAVERFGFDMNGLDAVVPRVTGLEGLDPVAPWSVAFWFGGWDPDLFATYFQGALEIPFAAPAAAPEGH